MFIEGFGEEGFLELNGDEFDSPTEIVNTGPTFGTDPLEKAMAGVQRRRSTQLKD